MSIIRSLLKAIVFIFVLFFPGQVFGEKIQTNFIASGVTTDIDSITCINLTTDQTITIPGDATLILETASGVLLPSFPGKIIKNYPNPFNNCTNLEINQTEPEDLTIALVNISGKIVCETQRFLNPGIHNIKVSPAEAGIYFCTVISGTSKSSQKMVCRQGNSGGKNIIEFGDQLDNGINQVNYGFKGTFSEYSLNFTFGDRISFTARSGRHCTTIVDTPFESTSYTFEFSECIDKDDRSYKTVKIGGQMWMAENLAYIDTIYMSSESPGIWVYDFEGSDKEQARSTLNFQSYGCLYNWETANGVNSESKTDICPDGWHIPSVDEWKELHTYLGGEEYQSYSNKWFNTGRVGEKLKAKKGWLENGNGLNSCSFNALPGGYRIDDGVHFGKGSLALFWSASPNSVVQSHFVGLGNLEYGLYIGVCSIKTAASVRCIKD